VLLQKELGMEQAASAKNKLLAQCREACKQAALGRADRTGTADDSAAFLVSIGMAPDSLGNAAGSLFREDCWEFTGRMEPSTRASNHRHINRVWELAWWYEK
jgi:hypothetical protein